MDRIVINAFPDADCKYCPKEKSHLGCHATCKEFKDWSGRLDSFREQEKANGVARSTTEAHIKKIFALQRTKGSLDQ